MKIFNSEIYLKYNYMIDTMELSTSHIDEESIERVVYFTAGCSFKLYPLRDINQFF